MDQQRLQPEIETLEQPESSPLGGGTASQQQLPAHPTAQQVPPEAAALTAPLEFSLRRREGPLPASPLEEPRWSQVSAWVNSVVKAAPACAAAVHEQPAAHVSASTAT